ncbi:MAG: hypothetical protein E7400_06735 [Ruminococcaceae bacterium]|nr:hypothetical protein [Oscillospiraceae bacterium]
MTKETIMRIKLTASEGMVLTDGESYGKEVFLAEGADADEWHEITQEEYDELMKLEREPDVADSI